MAKWRNSDSISRVSGVGVGFVFKRKTPSKEATTREQHYGNSRSLKVAAFSKTEVL